MDAAGIIKSKDIGENTIREKGNLRVAIQLQL